MTKKRPATMKRRGQRKDGGFVKSAPTGSRRPGKPKDPVTKALKADFDATHSEGMRALHEHDFDAVSRAISRERKLIGKQAARIATQRAKQGTRNK